MKVFMGFMLAIQDKIANMKHLTINKFGRAVILKKMRQQLRLLESDQPALEVEDDKLILRPLPVTPITCFQEWVMVVQAGPTGDLETAIESLREERLIESTAW